MATNNALIAWLGNRRVGVLDRPGPECYRFRYDEGVPADCALSLAMPVRDEPYETRILHPVFQQNLPEGALRAYIEDRIRKRGNRALDDLDDDLSILALTGRNQIGRIRVTAGEAPKTAFSHPVSIDRILEDMFPDDATTWFLDELGLESGVSGRMDKVLADDDSRVTLPMGRYIVKFENPRWPGIAVNEYHCAMAAKAAGLEIPRYHLSEDGDCLVVERFDDPDGSRPLAFEEACVLAGLPSHGKYNGSYEEMVDRLVARLPGRERRAAKAELFKSVALSMRLRNGDAHLKNFGVLYDTPADVRLAPTYDIVTTTVYLPRDTPALSIAGAKDWPDDAATGRFARSLGLSRAEALRLLDEVDHGVEKAAVALDRYGDDHPEHRAVCDALLKQWGREVDPAPAAGPR